MLDALREKSMGVSVGFLKIENGLQEREGDRESEDWARTKRA